MSAARPALRALAERLGILSSYWDIAGRQRPTSDATRVALLAGMGFDACDEAAAAAALAALDEAEAARWLEPVMVWRAFEGAPPAVPVRVPAGADTGEWRLALHQEDGAVRVAEGRLPLAGERDGDGRVRLPLPACPPAGYHALRFAARGPGFAADEEQRFVMAPRTALGVDERGVRGAFGIWANLYTVRGRRDFGFGDLGALRELLEWCGAAGGAFVGVNPLHALAGRGHAITPYSPTSRLFRSPLYLDVEAVPELAACAEARALLADPAFRAERARLAGARAIDHGAVLDAKLAVLRPLFAAFRAAGPGSPRAAAFAAFRAAQGPELEDFATYEVLAEHFGAPRAPATDWSAWPAPYRDPRSDAVAAFRREHAEAIAFRAWLQFELDRQLAETAARGRAAGCAIGVYQDLAVGSARDSADTWMAQALFARGVSVGAPPDDYAPDGQDWGFPPLDPHRLRADGYRFWSRLLRANFAHAGALRIDHAMGMMRLFWIPVGRPGTEGAYVTSRVDEMLGVLALESRRAGALVIAEDLGTVEPAFRERLADWDVLGSAVAWFERDGDAFRPPAAYPARALATVDTHDLVPLAGHRDGADLRIRRRAGQLADDEALAAALAERAREHEALLARLRADGFLTAPGEPTFAELCVAVHALLAATPSALVAASLDDLAGEAEPVNVPGIPVDRHRSWSRRMAVPLEALRGDLLAAAVLDVLRARRGGSPSQGL